MTPAAASRAFLCVCLALSAGRASAQSTEYTLDASGAWVAVERPDRSEDEQAMARIRELIAAEKFGRARELLDRWIERNEGTESPYLAEAYLLRGDTKLARGNEYRALRDYEEVVKGFPAADAYSTALEREHQIAVLYLNGLKRKLFGLFRVDSAEDLAEEILIRLNERLPGSKLAERSLLELADFYYRKRDLRMAAETYDVFLRIYPRSAFREKAMQRRVYANIARFKGPSYDASGLLDAQVQIREFAREFPAGAERAGMSDALLARLDESAGAQMLDTARFYLRRKDEVSARLTLRRLIKKHPGTAAASRAMELLDDRGWTVEPPPRAAPVQPVKTPGAELRR